MEFVSYGIFLQTLISAIECTFRMGGVLFALVLLVVPLVAPPTRLTPSPLAACSPAFSIAGACRGRSASSPGAIAECDSVQGRDALRVTTTRRATTMRGRIDMRKRNDDGHTHAQLENTLATNQRLGVIRAPPNPPRNTFALCPLLPIAVTAATPVPRPLSNVRLSC